MVKLELGNFNTTEETTTMSKDTRTMGKIVQIDDARSATNAVLTGSIPGPGAMNASSTPKPAR